MCPGLRSTEKIDRPLTIPLVWLQALTQSASLIKTPNCEALLNVLHAFDWAADKEIVSAYANLLLNLISSDVCHLAPTFQSIARNFLPRRSHNSLAMAQPNLRTTTTHHFARSPIHVFVRRLGNTNASKQGEKYDLLATEQIAKHLHQTIALILDLVPSSTSVLLDILEHNFPHKRLDVETHRCYLSNILQVASYCEALKSSILALAIKNILQIDMFFMLMQLFDTFILKTHKSKYVQFLLFYVCAMDINYTHAFVRYLLEKVMDVSNHPLTRSTCAAYLGSFLARSTLVPTQLVQEPLQIMSRWALQYGTQNRDTMPDAEVHGLFYSVCQAVFYVVCFKYQQLALRTPEGAAFLDSLELDAIIQSRLNPLRLCASTVVTEFLKVAADLCGLLPSARAVLERNKRVVLATKSVFGNANQLDSFFPFDPYLLRHSSKHISAIYQTWSPIPENPATATTAPPTTTTASTASTIARPSSSAAAPPSPAMRVPLTFLSSLPGSSSPNLGDGYGSSNETPPGTPNFLMRRGSIGGEELAASFTGSPGGFSSMLSMTPESVSNDVDFSWKYSWGGK
ncbi:RNA polymerase I specific transcription initiation factor RRN3 protein [Acanthamoeba castellanii str. Neff]|uniref:RNA polymerase I specific transcription initiation factor RRN3 protein n=1 Tax=Acanthamoeba castellanii (strain ATCC 30010 / Neff) TaxID=1257118 RepID=L8GN86_ACACF|nr:RNA polymerase I specific transcription initiation factor RRN3 protein [Acanthamoeba castellanii str. Neff]ELR13676.1 RNA polymerase I specific transcription initiation factor RRN3 protein [Acanthamoeba castellanii str. Neff]